MSNQINITTGGVSALAGIGNDFRFLQITAPVQPGNSGGPLLDLNGYVVGVIVSKLNSIAVAKVTGDIPQNVNFAIKASIARTFPDANEVKYTRISSKKKMDPADVGDQARKYTFLLECWK